MASHAAIADHNVRWMAAVLSLLPFALLFLVFAAGIAVPLWLYLAVLAWCLLMPAWMRDRQPRAGDTEPAPVTALAREVSTGESLSDQLNTLHRLQDLIDPAVFEVRGSEVTAEGLIFHGRLRATPQDVQEHIGYLASHLLGRNPHVMVHEDMQGKPYVVVASEA